MKKDDIERAVAYLEEHLDGEIDYAEAARRAYASCYHFQRVFGIVCGVTVGEYIRRRRLSRAAEELAGGAKVLDTALKYGYSSSESFSRAFFAFHGVLPSEVKRGSPAKSFPRLQIFLKREETPVPPPRIEMRAGKVLVGYKRRFCGVPYGEERLRQEHAFYSSTRGKQWLLLGSACDRTTEYAIVTNVGDDGYDYYIAYELDEWTRRALFDFSVTGIEIDGMGLEILDFSPCRCAVFATEKGEAPIGEYADLRKRIALGWLPESGYRLADAPEVVALHWRTRERAERYIKLWLPVEKEK